MDHAAWEQSAPDEGRGQRKKKNNEGARIVFGWGALGTFSPQRLEEYGKRHLRSRRQYVQKNQRSQGVEDVGRQLCQVVIIEVSERKQQEIKIEQVFRAGSISWLIAQHH